MKLLKRSEVIAVDDLKHEDVPVPAWGGAIRLRTMSGTERDEFRAAAAAGEGGVPMGKFSALLLVATAVDETGARIFTLDDVEALGEKNAEALDTVAAVAMRLNGLGGAAVSDAEKNSASTQSDDSGSASRSPSEKQ